MQTRIRREDAEKVKSLLRQYERKDIEYNEPHFTLKLDRQKIDRNEVIKNVLKPDNLVFVGVSESKNPEYDYVYDLYFRLGKNRIFKIPASLKPQSLYLITVIKIRTRIQDEALKYYEEQEREDDTKP
jgi:hypothetical protein